MSSGRDMVDGTTVNFDWPVNQRVMIYETRDGGTVCQTRESGGASNLEICSITSTCEHVEHYIKSNMDGVNLWEHCPEFWHITVPLVGSAGITTEMLVQLPTERHHWVDGLYLMLAEHDNPDKPGTTETIELGLVRRGEGRQYMREALFNWFAGVMDENELECKSASHGMKSQEIWELETANKTLGNQARFIQYWSVWETSQCRACRESDITDYSDFIPQPDDTAFRPAGWRPPSGPSGISASVPS